MADIQAIVARVRNKDYAAQAEAKRAGAAAVPALGQLLRDPDEEVRQLAVYCLSATGDPGAAPVLSLALPDADPQVAMAAAQALRAVATGADVPGLLQACKRVTEPAVKREVALVLGRCAGPGDVPEIHERWASETEPAARQGWTAALARLGNPDARAAFEGALLQSSGPDRLQHLELAEYIGQPWLLRALGKVLADTSDVLRVAVDAQPDLIQSLRACDLALVLISQIGNANFSFAVTRARNYTAAELDEARRFVSARNP